MSKLVQYLYSFVGLAVIWFIYTTVTVEETEALVVEDLQEIEVFVGPIVEEPAYIEPDIDTAELECLATNIYHEARGESIQGKMAVANVTLNRVHSHKFPDTVCGVVYQAVHSRWWLEHHNRLVPVRNMCQFSWYCDGKSDRIQLTTLEGNLIKENVQAWQDSHNVATLALLGQIDDLTDGATHYYNPELANPHWQYAMFVTARVDNHKFMRPY